MLVSRHILISLLLALIVVWFFGIIPALLFWIAGWIFDADHWIRYWIRTKDWNPLHAYRWHMSEATNNSNELYMFHTFEFILLIALFASINFYFVMIFFGWMSHLFLDRYDEWKNDHMDVKSKSIIKHLINQRQFY